MINEDYEAPFAWGLLDATVDFTVMPPRFRAPREVRPFITLNSEADIITKFSKDKDIRANFHLKFNRPMSSETQARVTSRKRGTAETDHKVTEMAQILNRHIIRAEFSFDSVQDDREEFEDPAPRLDSGKTKIVPSPKQEAPIMHIFPPSPTHVQTSPIRIEVKTERHRVKDSAQNRFESTAHITELPQAILRRESKSQSAPPHYAERQETRKQSSAKKERVLFPMAVANVPEYSLAALQQEITNAYIQEAKHYDNMNGIVGSDKLMDDEDAEVDDPPFIEVFYRDGFVIPVPATEVEFRENNFYITESTMHDLSNRQRVHAFRDESELNLGICEDAIYSNINDGKEDSIQYSNSIPNSRLPQASPTIELSGAPSNNLEGCDNTPDVEQYVEYAAQTDDGVGIDQMIASDKQEVVAPNSTLDDSRGSTARPALSFVNIDLDKWIENITVVAESCLTTHVRTADGESVSSLPPAVFGKEGDRIDNWVFKGGEWINVEFALNSPLPNKNIERLSTADILEVKLSNVMLNRDQWGRTALSASGASNIRGLNAYWLGPVTNDPRTQIGWKFARAVRQLNILKTMLASSNGAALRKADTSGLAPKRGRVPSMFTTNRTSLVLSIRSAINQSASSKCLPAVKSVDLVEDSSAITPSLGTEMRPSAFLTDTLRSESGAVIPPVLMMNDDDDDNRANKYLMLTPFTDGSVQSQSSTKSIVSKPVAADELFCKSPVHQYPSSTMNCKLALDLTGRIVHNGMLEITRKRGVVPDAMGQTEPWDERRFKLTDYELAMKDSSILTIQEPPRNKPYKICSKSSPSRSLPFVQEGGELSPPVSTPKVGSITAATTDEPLPKKKQKASQSLVKNLKKKMNLRQQALDDLAQERNELNVSKKMTGFKNTILSTDMKPRTYSSIAVQNDTSAPVPLMPWVPKGGIELMQSDKGDMYFNWEERRDLNKLEPVDSTRYKGVVMRQGIIRQSFERYVTGGVVSPFAKQNVGKSHMEFMAAVGGKKGPASFTTGSLALGSVTRYESKNSLTLGSKHSK